MGASSAEVRVLTNQSLGSGCFLLSFERQALKFKTGQYLSLGLPGHREQREYSIYSGESEDRLTVLIKELPEGLVSRRLAQLVPGDVVHVDGPFGYFTLDAIEETSVPLLFLATGTGISPFHSFVASRPDLNYHLFHGIRWAEETSLERGFDPNHVTSCVSREPGGTFHGRITDRLKTWDIPPQTSAFLCGNCDMIYEAFDLLRTFGVSSDRIHTEVYF